MKISDPAGNRTRAAEFEGRDSTNHATATDILFLGGYTIMYLVYPLLLLHYVKDVM